MKDPVKRILDVIKDALEATPAELSSDIIDRGIVLAGGGSQLRGLDQVLREKTGVPVNVADEPHLAIVKGCGAVIEDLEKFKHVLPLRMAKTELILKKNFDIYILFICVFASFLLIFSNNNKQIQKFRSNTLDAFSFVYQPFNWLDNQIFLTKKLEVLSYENLKLNLENQILFSNKAENERLRELLKFKKRNELDLIGADILSKGVNANMSSVLLDRGFVDGVEKNNAVLSSRGIVGKSYFCI